MGVHKGRPYIDLFGRGRFETAPYNSASIGVHRRPYADHIVNAERWLHLRQRIPHRGN